MKVTKTLDAVRERERERERELYFSKHKYGFIQRPIKINKHKMYNIEAEDYANMSFDIKS